MQTKELKNMKIASSDGSGKRKLWFKLILIEAFFIAVFILSAVFLLIRQGIEHKLLVDAGNLRYESYLLADQLRQSSDDLTRMVRTYATTRDEKYERLFWDILDIRNGKKQKPLNYERVYWDFITVDHPVPPFKNGEKIALDELMKQAGFTEKEFELLAISKRRSDKLVNLEKTAMNLMKKINSKKNKNKPFEDRLNRENAIQILFGKEYHMAKKSIMEPINEFYESIDKRTLQNVLQIENRVSIYQLLINFVFSLLILSSTLLLFSIYQHQKNMVGNLNAALDIKTKEINDRIQAEGALQESEEKYRDLVESTNSIIMKFDPDFNITFINQYALEFFGYTKQEVLGKNALGIYIPLMESTGRNLQNLMKDIIKNPSAYIDNENENMTKNGERVWVAWRNKGIYDDQGNLVGMLSLGYDITERRKAEEALQKSLDDLEKKVEIRTHELQIAMEGAEEANKAKSEFLANISHELRNPMHQILSYAKYGLDKIDKPKEKLWHYFNQARKAAERLMVLLNDLLDLSKMESGRMDYKMEASNVFMVIKEAASELNPAIEEKNLSLKLNDPSISTKVNCDAYKIGQVIRNLISNAIKFTPEEKSIEIVFQRNEMVNKNNSIPAIQVSVCDQGVGIPENELTSVFDKFTQSSKTKTGAGGTGLGLAICQEIIKAHKGKIWVENNREGGATFSFVLPYEQKIA